MKRTVLFSFLLVCSIVFLWGEDLKLTEGLWYIAMPPENSGEIKHLPSAFRFNADGSAELILEEEARRRQEELREMMKKRTGKEPRIPSYRWEWKDSRLILYLEYQLDNIDQTYVFSPFGEERDVLMPQKKTPPFIMLARKDAKLSPQQAKHFFEELNEATRDKFADGLKLPENIPLAEPGETLSNIHFFNHSHWRDAPEDSFQQVVLNAIDRGPRLADDATCSLPSLEKMLSLPESKAILLQYLACNPEWRLYRENDNTLHAVRYFRYPNGVIAPTLHQFYAHFLPTGEDGKKIGDAALEFQFRFEIALDGIAWNSNPAFPREKTEHRGNTWETRFKCGEALVNIFDQSQFKGRQMTAAALEYSEREFARLHADMDNWRNCLPADSFRIGEPELLLRNGNQGGIYEASIWCNPGEKGMIFLKAFELTTGKPLSSVQLKRDSNCVSGWSNNVQEQFQSAAEFTIYEGEWDQFYGARFEIWFKPDSDAPERKLFEKNYKIQGWQR